MWAESQKVLITLEQIVCVSCGVVYGLSSKFARDRRDDHATFYCPNGHSQWYPGETEAEKLKKQLAESQKFLANAQKRVEWAEQGEKNARERADRAQRSAASYRGKLTHVKKRVAAGCCPCCRRNFQNLQRHMATQHPAYGSEKESEG